VPPQLSNYRPGVKEIMSRSLPKRPVLIADTAGRLQTQSNLMAELVKVKRVMGKDDTDGLGDTDSLMP